MKEKKDLKKQYRELWHCIHGRGDQKNISNKNKRYKIKNDSQC